MNFEQIREKMERASHEPDPARDPSREAGALAWRVHVATYKDGIVTLTLKDLDFPQDKLFVLTNSVINQRVYYELDDSDTGMTMARISLGLDLVRSEPQYIVGWATAEVLRWAAKRAKQQEAA
jgi:hypothetical protein